MNGFNVAEPRVATTTYRVIYADTDQMGIVYHGTYLQFFERGRNEYVRSSGVSHAEFEAKGYILPLVESYVRYRTPARFDELVSIQTLVSRVSRLKVNFEYKIFKPATVKLATGEVADEGGRAAKSDADGDASILVAEGRTVHGCLDKSLRPARIPDDWRNRLLRLRTQPSG